MRYKKIFFAFILFLVSISLFSLTSAANSTVCCEKTKSNLFCQNVPSEECASDARAVPTSCESTAYCKPGVCYNSAEGTCLDNTPQIVCNANNGIWNETAPAQCTLGCCILGDQAAFVSLVKCKKLSSFLGLQTNYKQNIQDEVQCVLQVQNQEKGACVYESEFQKTCRITTRAECTTSVNGTGLQGDFFSGKLCTAEDIGAPCARTTKTTCLPGKDGVYFVDSCGNTANIYDSSKINDALYWSTIKDTSESCGPGAANSNSKACGNCNYLQGSVCRPATSGNLPTYGENICADLNCKKTKNGKSYKHGESWCVNSDIGKIGEGTNAVGSRFFKHICINGEEVVEQCADFRQEECIESTIKAEIGSFSQAACRVNRWQDCTAQADKSDCENTDRRDCQWKAGIGFGNSSATAGVCLPKNAPGLKFWEGEDTKTICAQANAQCIVTFEKSLIGGEKCVANCHCVAQEWTNQRNTVCSALGDCGPKINWVGQEGYKKGFLVNTTRAK